MPSGPTFIHPTSEVSDDALVGEGTAIWNWSKVRERAILGEQCNVGQSVYIDIDVVLGARCKVQNGVSIFQGVTLGAEVFVGPNATFTNDLYPRAQSPEWTIIPTVVEKGASIGANATIVCGVKLGTYCMVGAGAVVTHDVPPHALVVGQPARVIDYVTVAGSRLNWADPSVPPPVEMLKI